MKCRIDVMLAMGVLPKEALLVGHLQKNLSSSQPDFSKEFSVGRNLTSQLFRKCCLKGWIEEAHVRLRRDPKQPSKTYKLTAKGHYLCRELF
jgi:hypothetical protein